MNLHSYTNIVMWAGITLMACNMLIMRICKPKYIILEDAAGIYLHELRKAFNNDIKKWKYFINDIEHFLYKDDLFNAYTEETAIEEPLNWHMGKAIHKILAICLEGKISLFGDTNKIAGKQCIRLEVDEIKNFDTNFTKNYLDKKRTDAFFYNFRIDRSELIKWLESDDFINDIKNKLYKNQEKIEVHNETYL